MQFEVFLKKNIQDLSGDLLLENGRLKLLPAAYYRNLKWEDFRIFCHCHARYGIPTIELIDYLKDIIGNRSALEIGAGAGDLGYHLKIPMIDNKMQSWPEISKIYEGMGQPTIKYPDDIEEIDALEAVKKYKPQVVIGSWITSFSSVEQKWRSSPFGIKEPQILDLVETFIIVGNLDEHFDKPIRQIEHQTIHADWLVSRKKNQKNNCIFIWSK